MGSSTVARTLSYSAREDNADQNSRKNISRIQGYIAEPVDLNFLRRCYNDSRQGRRIAPRFDINLDVILFTTNQTFRTSSRNVSAAGVLLADLLPAEFMDVSLEVVLVQKNEWKPRPMIFRAKTVGGPLRSHRIAFVESALNSQSALMELFQGLIPLSECNETAKK